MSFENNLDLLYFSLTIFIGCMTILLSILVIKVLNILTEVRKITDSAKEVVELVNNFAWNPVEIIMYLKDFFIGYLQNKKKKKKK